MIALLTFNAVGGFSSHASFLKYFLFELELAYIISTLMARIILRWLSELRRLWTSVN